MNCLDENSLRRMFMHEVGRIKTSEKNSGSVENIRLAVIWIIHTTEMNRDAKSQNFIQETQKPGEISVISWWSLYDRNVGAE